MTEIFKSVTDWYLANLNFGTITLLMAVESPFIPFPSEIVIPPAAFQAQGIPQLLMVILAGVLGSLIGAVFNYYMAIWLGRPLIHRFAKTKLANLLLITPEGVDKSEAYFRKYGKSATFFGRLIPAVRQLISLPAGLAKMPLGTFILFTTLGSALWTSILAVAGYLLKTQKHIFDEFYNEITWGLIILATAFVLMVILKVFVFKKKKAPETETPQTPPKA